MQSAIKVFEAAVMSGSAVVPPYATLARSPIQFIEDQRAQRGVAVIDALESQSNSLVESVQSFSEGWMPIKSVERSFDDVAFLISASLRSAKSIAALRGNEDSILEIAAAVDEAVSKIRKPLFEAYENNSEAFWQNALSRLNVLSDYVTTVMDEMTSSNAALYEKRNGDGPRIQ